MERIEVSGSVARGSGLCWLRLGRPSADHNAECEEEGRHNQHGEQDHGRPSLVPLKLCERRVASLSFGHILFGVGCHESLRARADSSEELPENSRERLNFQQVRACSDDSHKPAAFYGHAIAGSCSP